MTWGATRPQQASLIDHSICLSELGHGRYSHLHNLQPYQLLEAGKGDGNAVTQRAQCPHSVGEDTTAREV